MIWISESDKIYFFFLSFLKKNFNGTLKKQTKQKRTVGVKFIFLNIPNLPMSPNFSILKSVFA